jgi:hypothetical protein
MQETQSERFGQHALQERTILSTGEGQLLRKTAKQAQIALVYGLRAKILPELHVAYELLNQVNGGRMPHLSP